MSYAGSEVVLRLTHVTNAQVLTVELNDITTLGGGLLPSASLRLGVLIGDVTGDGAVTDEDVRLVQDLPNSRRAVSEEDFRSDINANGALNGRDFAHVRSRVGSVIE